MSEGFNVALIGMIVGFFVLELIRRYVPQPFQADAAYFLAFMISTAQWYHVETIAFRHRVLKEVSEKLLVWLKDRLK